MEQNIWIEARHTNLHGEPGKDLGSNKYKLDKNNVKSKKNFIMSEIKVNDFIIHLRMEKKLKEICGISIVEQLVHDEQYHKCILKNYVKFDNNIHIYDDFFNRTEYKNTFLDLLQTKIKGETKFLLFHKNNKEKFQITESRYFSRCPLELLELINDQYIKKNPTKKQLPLIDYEINKKDTIMDVEDVLKDTFFSKEKFLKIIDTLKLKKNIIIEGPPGVGKTFIAKKIADYFCNNDKSKQSRLVFHENYSYEEFIMGIRPDETGKLALAEGQFLKLCKKAQGDLDSKYIILIDEINRANITRVFGEILVCIENDKRGTDNSVNLLYKPDEDFYIPENIHIIGLMNTADKSLKALDFALRRRFEFFTFSPEYGEPDFKKFLENKKVNKDIINKIILRMGNLNNKIKADDLNLGKGYCIGHSFFCPSNTEQKLDHKWYEDIIRYEISPLLEEYFRGEEGNEMANFQKELLS
jgi:Cdc6-like AAA superfamily ATPase